MQPCSGFRRMGEACPRQQAPSRTMKMKPVLAFSVLFVFCLLCCLESPAQKPDDAKVSSYAPAKELLVQIKSYVDKISGDVSDEKAYGDDQRGRIEKDASTVAVLALMLGMHDEETKLKKSAYQLIELAIELVDQVDEYSEAKEAYSELKAALDEAEEGDDTSWEPAADLALLMQQVPIVNNSLRRGVTSRRFERSAPATAGHAVTLASLAQASLLDTAYCGDEDDEKEWCRICVEMREACAEVYRAVLKKDQEAAKKHMEKIVTTCDECHEKFRD